MTPEQLQKALAAGIITQHEHDTNLIDWNSRESERDEVEKAETWYKELEAAPLAHKKKMVKEQAFNLQVKSSMTSDRQESRRVSNIAYQLRYALKGAGGISF